MTLPEMIDLADRLATVDGFVPKALLKRPPAIVATLLAGAELGLGPMESLRAIHVIEGRVTLSAEVARALVYAAGHTLRIDATDTYCTVMGKRRDESHWTTVEWTLDRARRAKLASRNTWQMYPRQMLAARATSELCRLVFPDALAGLDVDELFDEEQAPEPVKPRKLRAPRATVPAPPLDTLDDQQPAHSHTEPPDETRQTPSEATVSDEQPPLPGETAPQTIEAGRLDIDDLPLDEPVPVDRARMLRRLHARVGETFPGASTEARDAYRHALVALTTRHAERPGGMVQSSAQLDDAEQFAFEARLNEIQRGETLIARRDDGSVEVRSQGWVYIITFEPLDVQSHKEHA